jgi:hypothetical protein
MTIRVYCYMGSEYAFNFREQLITVIGLPIYFSGNRDSEQGVNYTVSTSVDMMDL